MGRGWLLAQVDPCPQEAVAPLFTKEKREPLSVSFLPSDTASCSTRPSVRQSPAYLSVFLMGSTCPRAYLVARLPGLIQGCYPQASGCSANWTPPMPWERAGVRSCDGASSVPAGTRCPTPMMLKGVA